MSRGLLRTAGVPSPDIFQTRPATSLKSVPWLLLPRLFTVLGVGFLAASVRLFLQFSQFLRLRSSAVLIWPGRKPPFYMLLLALGAILSVIIVVKLALLQMPPKDVFGETMMLVYYAYAVPLSLKIGRGFYQDGIWSDGGFIPYSHIGGLTWREGEQVTLVLMHRMRAFARRLVVPERPLRRGAASAARQDRRARHPLHGQAARPRHARRAGRCLNGSGIAKAGTGLGQSAISNFLSHPIGPPPVAIGSLSQSGGVSQTKARMAITIRSYCQVARVGPEERVPQDAHRERRRVLHTTTPTLRSSRYV